MEYASKTLALPRLITHAAATKADRGRGFTVLSLGKNAPRKRADIRSVAHGKGKRIPTQCHYRSLFQKDDSARLLVVMLEKPALGKRLSVRTPPASTKCIS